MQTLMKMALSSYYPMIIAPLLDPTCEAPEAIQVGAIKSIRWASLSSKASFLNWMKWSKNRSLTLHHSDSIKESMLYL